MIYALFLLTGALAGLCAGLFGVGGGLVIVPVLMYLFGFLGMNADVVAHVALGTSLATIMITSISSLMAHHKAGNVHWDVFYHMAMGLALGSLCGAYVAKLIHSDDLKMIVGVGIVLMASKMLFLPNQERTNKSLPAVYIQSIASVGIGGLSAVFGIGGGSLTVPFLNYCGLSMQKAVGTSSACGLPIAIAGAMGFMIFGHKTQSGLAGTIGFVHVGAFCCISMASFMTAKIGAKISHQLPAKTLKKAFGFLLLVMGIMMIVKT